MAAFRKYDNDSRAGMKEFRDGDSRDTYCLPNGSPPSDSVDDRDDLDRAEVCRIPGTPFQFLRGSSFGRIPANAVVFGDPAEGVIGVLLKQAGA
jgi:hypothetical protein